MQPSTLLFGPLSAGTEMLLQKAGSRPLTELSGPWMLANEELGQMSDTIREPQILLLGHVN